MVRVLAVFFIHDDYVEWFWNNEDLDRIRSSFIKKVNQNPEYLTKLVEEWHHRLLLFNEVNREIDQSNLQKLSDEQLLLLYGKWNSKLLNQYCIAVCFQDAFSMRAELFLCPHFEHIIPPEKFEDYYLALISPITESFITQEYRDRLHLLNELPKDEDIKKKLEEHAQKYHWINNNYAKDICLDAEHFYHKVQEISHLNPLQELRKLDHSLAEIKTKKQNIIKELQLDQESKNLINITETFAYMQDERKKYVLIASHYENIFLKECARRLEVDVKELEYTYIHELPTILKNKKLDKKLLTERRTFCFVVHSMQGYEVFSGNIAKDIFETVFQPKDTNIQEIKGTIASKGTAVGPVKIVRKIHDVSNVQQGDILVASMTRPEMVIAMEKAAVIITDEGGITSHAAVVSRELGIPCIINTKVATHLLHDGEIVQVDAEKGIVKKIKIQ